MRSFDSKRRSRLRQTISLRIPLACLQSHCLHTSCEIKRLLFSGCEAIIFLMVATSFLLTNRLRYVTIASIPDNINYQDSERKFFLKETYRAMLNLKFWGDFLLVNGYSNPYASFFSKMRTTQKRRSNNPYKYHKELTPSKTCNTPYISETALRTVKFSRKILPPQHVVANPFSDYPTACQPYVHYVVCWPNPLKVKLNSERT